MSAAGSSVQTLPLARFRLWPKLERKRTLYGFNLEITARCNHDCRHCYINRPAHDTAERQQELTVAEVARLASEVAELGGLWCVLGGGEPLLREDFAEIYLTLKRRGLLITLFTNATLITERHAALLKKYPPRDVEVTVYGVTPATYERVTRRPGAFEAFQRGLRLLREAGIPVRLKAMALRSNVHELRDIIRFCRANTKDWFRFDPFLQLRVDGDPVRNAEIRAERLSPEEVVAVELAEPPRAAGMLRRFCHVLEAPRTGGVPDPTRLFRCGVGEGSFDISSSGLIRPCNALWHPDFVYDWRKGTVRDAWENFFPRVLPRTSTRPEFVERCGACELADLCMWCPANAYLETGELDVPVVDYCRLASARLAALREARMRQDRAGRADGQVGNGPAPGANKNLG